MVQKGDLNYSGMASLLEQTGEYRVLRRLKHTPVSPLLPDGPQMRKAIILDLETTGVDIANDEIIEIGMLKIAYSGDDEVVALVDTFASLNQPSRPIPEEVVNVTHITQEMVEGQRIEAERVRSFIADSAVIIAHNARFDRNFSERYWPDFELKPWACSATQIDWQAQGYEGSRLTYLLNEIGLFHSAHRALDDCYALLEVLRTRLRRTGAPPFAVLLEQARRPTIRIWAEGAPFDFKEELKRRRYRWNDGCDGRPRSWYVEVTQDQSQSEMQFLRTKVFGRDVTLRIESLNAITRFSNRKSSAQAVP